MKSGIVLDSSMTTTWVIDEEYSDRSQDVLDQVVKRGGIVPILWPIEAASVLRHNERRGRINARQVAAGFAFYERLSPAIDTDGLIHINRKTFDLARQYDLTVYDATYLELALRRNLPLATYDQDLRKAATTAGIELL